MASDARRTTQRHDRAGSSLALPSWLRPLHGAASRSGAPSDSKIGVRLCRWSAVAGVLVAFWAAMAGTAHADQRDRRLDGLFQQLRSAASPLQAAPIAERIWAIWNTPRDPELDELMRDGSAALERKELPRSIAIFSLIIERDPEFAEAWNKRATAYFLMRDFESSIRDVIKVLELEPRHFQALSGMGLIYTELRADALALRWFERALEVHPHFELIARRAKSLRVKLGQGVT